MAAKKTIIFIMMFLISLSYAFADNDLSINCISCWDKNASSEAVDFFGNNTLPVVNTVGVIPNCHIGSCNLYTEAGYFRTTSPKPPPEATDWALSIWVNTTDTPNSAEHIFQMGEWAGSTNTAFHIFQASADGNLDVELRGETWYDIANLNRNVWNHLIFSWNESAKVLTFYLNGKKNGTTTLNTITLGTVYIAFGVDDGLTVPLEGELDVISLFDIALYDNSCASGSLCEGDIATLWNSGAGRACNNLAIIPDTTAPVISRTWNTTFPTKDRNMTFNFTAIDADNNVDNITFYWNETGTWDAKYNITGIGASAASYNISLNITTRTRGEQFSWNITACDDQGNCGNSATFLVTINNTAPVLKTDLEFTNASAGHWFNFSFEVTDLDGGSDINTASVEGSAGTCALYKNSTSGTTFRVEANCSGTALTSTTVRINVTDYGGVRISSSQVVNTYPNQVPSIPSLTSPADGDHNNDNQTLTYSSTDADGDTVNYFVYHDTNTDPTTIICYTTGTTCEGNATSGGGTYYWKVLATDTYENSSNSSIRNWIFDIIDPTITLVAGGFLADNSSKYNTPNLPINITFADTYLFQALINITDVDGLEKWAWTALNLNATSYNKNETIDMTGWVAGNYTIKVQATDDNTLTAINPYAVTKTNNINEKSLRYYTTEGNTITITSLNKNLVKSFSTTKLTDRYNFEFDYKTNAGVLTFLIKSDKKLYFDMRRGYPHFNVWNAETERGNWIDFNYGLKKNKYVVDKISDYEYRVYLVTDKVSIKINSIGGTNTATKYYKIGFDNTPPDIDFSTGTPANRSWLSQNWVFVNVSVNDTNLGDVKFNWDGTNETFDANYYENQTSLPDENYTFYAWANDTYGNENTTSVREVYLDTKYPSIDYAGGTTTAEAYYNQDWIYVNVSVTELNFNNISFYLYNSSGIVNQTNYTTQTYNINFTSLTDATYSINVSVWDKASNKNSTATRRNIVLDIKNPGISYSGGTLTNATWYSQDWVYMNFSITEPNLDTVTLEWNGTNETLWNRLLLDRFNYTTALSDNGALESTVKKAKTFSVNYTGIIESIEIPLRRTTNSVPFNISIEYANSSGAPNGTVIGSTKHPAVTSTSYVWYMANFTNDVRLEQGTNYTLVVFTPTASDSYWWGTGDSDINKEWTGDGVANPWTEFAYNFAVKINIKTNTTVSVYSNKTSLTDGNYTFRAYVNDTVGLTNQTGVREVYLDTTYPQIDFDTGTTANNTWVNRTWLYADISLTEINFANISYYITNTSFVNETNLTTKTLFINFTGLTEGTYSYNVTATDKANNINYTSTRILNVDFYSPSITNLKNHSSDGSSVIYNNLDAYVNATVYDKNINTVLVSGNWSGNWNNFSMSNRSNNYYYLIDDTNLIDNITYSWFVFANDSFVFNTTSLMQSFYVTDSGTYNPEVIYTSSSGTLTYAAAGNKYFNLSLPRYSTIKSSTLDLSNQSIGVKNVTVKTNNIIVFQNLSTLNTSAPMNGINLNNGSVLQDCIDTGAIIQNNNVICNVNISVMSVGGIDYTYNITYYPYRMFYTDPAIETSLEPYALRFNYNASFNYTASIYLNNTLHSATRTIDTVNNFTSFNVSLYVPHPEDLSNEIPLYWRYNKVFPSETQTYATATENQTIYQLLIDDCTSGDTTQEVLTFFSINEETNLTIDDMDLDITLQVWREDSSTYRNYSFEFSGETNYTLCVSNLTENTQFSFDAIMSYNAPEYTTKSYYIVDLNFGVANQTVYLYQLNDTIASDITFLVLDGPSGDKVSEAYIHIQRYYPGENLYKTVEIARTDENGQTIGKLVLADVFYKFLVILNQNVELDTSVQKMLSTTKTLIINTVEDELESWKRMSDVSTSVTCTEATQTCRFQWADTTGIVRSAKLEVHRISTYGKTLLSSTSLTATSGSLVYVIAENTTNKRYLAQGFIDTTTANSEYPIGIYELIYRGDIGTLFGRGGVALLFPLMLLVVSLSAVMLEVGAIGVVTGSLIALIGGMSFGLIPLGITSIISLVVIGGILIYKLKD